jgi:hypothetical protein
MGATAALSADFRYRIDQSGQISTRKNYVIGRYIARYYGAQRTTHASMLPAGDRRMLNAADITMFDRALFASITIVHDGELA